MKNRKKNDLADFIYTNEKLESEDPPSCRNGHIFIQIAAMVSTEYFTAFLILIIPIRIVTSRSETSRT